MKNFTENKIFRGKKIATQQWVIGYYCPLNGEEALIIDYVDDTVHPYEFVYYKVYADSVGMYIGKDDINGKQIFEGDILKVDNYIMYGEGSKEYQEVGFEYGSFMTARYGGKAFNTYLWIIVSDGCEVVGNIYENKELIEKSS